MNTYIAARRRFAALALALPLAVFALGLMIASAFAGDDTTVNALPLYKILEPYLIMVVGLIVTTALGWIGSIIKARFGIELDASMNAKIQSAAMNAAGAVIAKAEGPIGNLSIDVRSPMVKDGVELLFQKVPDSIEHFGLTADQLAKLIQGKIGILQASAPSPAKP